LFVHVTPQRSGVAPLQFEEHVDPPHTGVGAWHVTPQAPQFPFCERLFGQPLPASAQSA
jgi:hypothetical protein